MSFVRIPNTGRVAAYSRVILPVGRARLLATGLPRGPEVRFEETRWYGALLALRSLRTPFLDSFRVAYMRSEFARLWAHGCQTCVHRSFLRRTAAGPSER